MYVLGATAVLASGLLENACLRIQGGRITELAAYNGGRLAGEPVIDGTGLLVLPGFIDLHIHGGGGADVMDGTAEALEVIGQTHGRHGTTGYLATTLTAPPAALKQALQTAAAAREAALTGARVLGVHLEGPFINPKYKGAQNAAYIRQPAADELAELLAVAPGLVKLLTYAPEGDPDGSFARYLAGQGVIPSAGHTDATYDQVAGAHGHGLSHVTHCYNAMRGLHHREPGVVGAALALPGLRAELIADGHHVHPGAMAALVNAKPAEQVVAVTDAMRAADLADGEYDLGGLPVKVAGGTARLSDGTLAGSVLTMEQAVANLVNLVGLPLHRAVNLASLNPAIALGLQGSKGSLAVGNDADLVLLTPDYNVVATYVGGQPIYRR